LADSKSDKAIYMDFRTCKRKDPEIVKNLDKAYRVLSNPEKYNKKFLRGGKCLSNFETLDYLEYLIIKDKTTVEQKRYDTFEGHIFSCYYCFEKILYLSALKTKEDKENEKNNCFLCSGMF